MHFVTYAFVTPSYRIYIHPVIICITSHMHLVIIYIYKFVIIYILSHILFTLTYICHICICHPYKFCPHMHLYHICMLPSHPYIYIYIHLSFISILDHRYHTFVTYTFVIISYLCHPYQHSVTYAFVNHIYLSYIHAICHISPFVTSIHLSHIVLHSVTRCLCHHIYLYHICICLHMHLSHMHSGDITHPPTSRHIYICSHIIFVTYACCHICIRPIHLCFSFHIYIYGHINICHIWFVTYGRFVT